MAEERTDLILEFDEELQAFDLRLDTDTGDLKKDRDLFTSLIVSVLADRRSFNDDPIPNSKGWSGDSIKRDDEENVGSRIWLLGRRKTTQETLNLLDEYAREALDWYVFNDIAERYELETFYLDKVAGIAVLLVRIYTKEGNIEKRFEFAWRQLEE